MNKPDKAGEPSMEEILASIRQIIADEPAAEQPDPVIEANPLVPHPQTTPKADAPQPLSDRLSNVLRSGPLPPTSPFGSKRPSSFDQDLADMFDEDEATNGGAAPKPDLRVPEGLSHPMVRKSFVPSSPNASIPREEAPKPFTDGAAALPPQFATSASSVPPPPFGGAEKPAPATAVPTAAPVPPTSYGFPPLRKTSFYPPQSSTGSTPANGARAEEQPAGARLNGAHVSPASPSPEAGAGSASPIARPVPSASSSLEEALRMARASAASSPAPAAEPKLAPGASAGPVLGSAPPKDTLAAGFKANETPSPQSSASPRPSNAAPSFAAFAPTNGAASAGGSSTSAPSYTATNGSPLAGSSTASNAQPAAPERQDATARTSPVYGSSSPFGASVSPAAPEKPAVQPEPARPQPSAPVEPRSFGGPITGSPPDAPGFSSQSRFASGADVASSAAAHNALDALALGLAASAAAASAPLSSEPQSPIIPLTPVVEPAYTPASEPAAPSPSTLPVTVQPYGASGPPRTLEDAVADMLRPMLQQWVADNMPRIIERALRTEVENTIKPGNKPSGS